MLCEFETDCDCGEPLEFGADILLPATWFLKIIECATCGGVYHILVSDGKPARKMQDKTRAIQLEILATFRQEAPPVSIRHLFYRASGKDLVPKTEGGYRSVQGQTKKMRLVGSLPYGWISDNSRSFYKPTTFYDMAAALQNMQEYYRRDLWARSDVYVQIWVEKDAMVSVIRPVTHKYDVQLSVAKGYSSMTFIYETAEAIRASGKDAYIYYFGDFDYDGVYAADYVPEKLWERHRVKVNYERVCVTDAQIQEYNLATREPKKKSRDKWPYDYAVDIDTLSPNLVRNLVEECILKHVNQDEIERMKQIEEQEKETMKTVMKNLGQLLS